LSKEKLKKECDKLQAAMETFWQEAGFKIKISDVVEEDQKREYLDCFGKVWDGMVILHNALEKFKKYGGENNGSMERD